MITYMYKGIFAEILTISFLLFIHLLNFSMSCILLPHVQKLVLILEKCGKIEVTKKKYKGWFQGHKLNKN